MEHGTEGAAARHGDSVPRNMQNPSQDCPPKGWDLGTFIHWLCLSWLEVTPEESIPLLFWAQLT